MKRRTNTMGPKATARKKVADKMGKTQPRLYNKGGLVGASIPPTQKSTPKYKK